MSDGKQHSKEYKDTANQQPARCQQALPSVALLYHIFPPSNPPPAAINPADVFASKNNSFISAMSSTSISERPARVARMDAGVKSCSAYLVRKGIEYSIDILMF
jgi:hypothetical protein